MLFYPSHRLRFLLLAREVGDVVPDQRNLQAHAFVLRDGFDGVGADETDDQGKGGVVDLYHEIFRAFSLEVL